VSADSYRWDPADQPPPPPPLFLEPLRLVVLAGAVVGLAGAAVPWAHGRTSFGAEVYTPVFADDGILLVFAVLGTVGLVVTRQPAEARIRTMQVLPAIVAFVSVAAWLFVLQTQQALLASRRELWSTENDIGAPVSGLGVAAMTIAAVLVSLRTWRSNGTVRDPGDTRLTPRSIVRVLVEVAFGVVGMVAAAGAVLIVLGVFGLIFMTIAAVLGGLTGLSVGERVARRI